MTSGLPSQGSIREAGPSSAKTDKPDFGWLTDSLRNKVKESQKYSTVARLNGLEGRVVLRITVKENGELLVAIAKSSGHDLLDQEALEQVKRLSPFPLSQPLGRAQQVLNLPITYSLNQ
jgi:protein TonB